MRVVAGEAKGRRLKSVPGHGTRPILDRVKVALFDVLGQRVVDAIFLDLFAGTGSVGIEALSRGARQAWFVDADARAVATVKRNLEITGLADRAQVRRLDSFRFLKQTGELHFDIIFVAPPQYQGLVPKVMSLLDTSDAIAQGGTVITQLDPKEYTELDLRSLRVVDQRRYGSTLLTFYGRAIS